MVDIKYILDAFNDEIFQKQENFNLLSDNWRKPSADWVISFKEDTSIYAIIVKTSEAKNCQINRTYGKRIIKEMVLSTEAWFGILVDGEKIFIFEPISACSGKFYETTVDGILAKILLITNDIFNPEKSLKELVKIIRTQQNKNFTKRESLIKDIIQDTIEDIINNGDEFIDSHVNHRGRLFSLSLSYQFKILVRLLESIGVQMASQLCRYTSLGSLTRHLSEKTDSMCGLAAMNDKSEGFYLEKCLSNKASINIYSKSPNVIAEYNKAFITSLCNFDKADDLTMWRLYGGNDGDGCCLIYEPDLESIQKSNNFILIPVCYANNNNVLVQLFRYLRQYLPFIGYRQFGFSHMSVWSYFVKPEGFEIEKEYRLLFLYDKNDATHPVPKWLLNNDKNIYFPIMVFDNNPQKVQYPLKLKKIIIGPKCGESHVNRVQLRQWIRDLNLQIDVEESKIDFYR